MIARIGFLLIITTILAGPVIAQYHVGLLGGLNHSDMYARDEDEVKSTTPRLLVSAGGIISRDLTQHVSLQVKALYLQKGSVIKNSYPDPDVTVSSVYLELPVHLKATYGEKLRPYLYLGPSLGIMISTDLESTTPYYHLKSDATDIMKVFDLGFGIGAGASLQIGRGTLFLESCITRSLGNLNEGGTLVWTAQGYSIQDQVEEEEEYRNKGIQILVGYTIPLITFSKDQSNAAR